MNGLLVVMPSLEVQGKLGGQLLFAGIAKCLEPLCQQQVKSRAGNFGEPSIQNFAIK